MFDKALFSQTDDPSIHPSLAITHSLFHSLLNLQLHFFAPIDHFLCARARIFCQFVCLLNSEQRGTEIILHVVKEKLWFLKSMYALFFPPLPRQDWAAIGKVLMRKAFSWQGYQSLFPSLSIFSFSSSFPSLYFPFVTFLSPSTNQTL